MTTITAVDIEHILNQWASRKLSEPQVHAWAEDRFCTSTYEGESEAVNEVLSRLDTMNMNLTTAEDIPAFKAALHSKNFISILAEYESRINIEERKLKLRQIPFYAHFCE
ncbi:MAG: hypothetical protein V4508_18330 [Pseudomonadota bacterium]